MTLREVEQAAFTSVGADAHYMVQGITAGKSAEEIANERDERHMNRWLREKDAQYLVDAILRRYMLELRHAIVTRANQKWDAQQKQERRDTLKWNIDQLKERLRATFESRVLTAFDEVEDDAIEIVDQFE